MHGLNQREDYMSKQQIFLRLTGEPVESGISPFAHYPKELAEAVKSLSKLDFPIDSKIDLVKKLGGERAKFKYGRHSVSAATIAMFIPAELFPFTSPENMAEKISEFYYRRGKFERIIPMKPEEMSGRLQKLIQDDPELIKSVSDVIFRLSTLRNITRFE